MEKSTYVENKLLDIVSKTCMESGNIYGYSFYSEHILKVYEIVRSLYRNYNADLSIVGKAAILHDIAAIKDKKYIADHHQIGVSLVGPILTRLEVPENEIELIQRCIFTHRLSTIEKRKTNEEVCLAEANSIAYFNNVAVLNYIKYSIKKCDIDVGKEEVLKELDLRFKDMSKIGQSIVSNQYSYIKQLYKK